MLLMKVKLWVNYLSIFLRHKGRYLQCHVLVLVEGVKAYIVVQVRDDYVDYDYDHHDHHVVCLARGLRFLPKRILQIVRSPFFRFFSSCH